AGRRLDQRKHADLSRRLETRPGRLTVLAAVRMTLGGRERELVELVIERVDEDLVELLAIHGRALAQCARVLLEVGESFLQSLERVPHSTLDRVFWCSGDLGNFLERKVGDVAQEEHFALLAR